MFHFESSKDLPILKLLVKHGACLLAKEAHGRTCLHIAAYAKQKEIFYYLLDHGLSIYDTCSNKWTMLHSVCKETF